MDPIEVEKLRAMAKYKKKTHFLHKLGIYLLSTVITGLFLSCPLWIPPLCFCIKSFLLVSLPKIVSYLLCPKFLFIISNVIVFILVGESKFLASPKSKTADIYDEYVKRQKGCHKLSASPATKKEVHFHEENAVIEKSVVKARGKENQEMEEELLNEDENDEEELQTKEGVDDFKVKNEEEEEEEDCGLPVDELNKRVEDFIAKFNQQRRLEAKLLISKG